MTRIFLIGWLSLLANLTVAQTSRGVTLDPQTSNTSSKRTALLIGNAAYQNAGTLRNPLNDVKAMTGALRDLGFEVVVHTNLDREGMERVVNNWGKTLPNYGVALFYYAGHGAEVGGVNYLLPTDANPQNQSQVKFQAHPVDMVIGWMEEAKVKTNIVLLDACRDNPFSRSWSRSANEGGLANMNAPAGTFVGFAASPGKTAADGDRANGLYTEAILQAINKPNLTIDQVFNRVNQHVRQQSNGAQVPFKNSSLEDDFYFSVTATVTKPESLQAIPAEVKTEVTRSKPDKAEPKDKKSASAANPTRKFMDLPFAEMAFVEGGTFEMGDTYNELGGNATPVHTVTVNSFWIGQYEVTQKQWLSVMGNYPSHFKKCDDCPVEQVSWKDVQTFLQKLNERTSMKYRLPTEAEWEFAARERGKPVRFANGKDVIESSEVNADFSGNNSSFLMFTKSNVKGTKNRQKTTSAGSFKPNALGLYDMCGNVAEWCNDYYGTKYYEISPRDNPEGPQIGDFMPTGEKQLRACDCRVTRGGSWSDYSYVYNNVVYAAGRDGKAADFGEKNIGFRLVQGN